MARMLVFTLEQSVFFKPFSYHSKQTATENSFCFFFFVSLRRTPAYQTVSVASRRGYQEISNYDSSGHTSITGIRIEKFLRNDLTGRSVQAFLRFAVYSVQK